jgi:hypothetical protein
LAAMFTSNNVIDFRRIERETIRHSAVFAPFLCPLYNLPP